MKKTKAFTLTELLVVVVIIGVLSAIVLPKFSKVLETRKTTEAEAMLMAVRGEQEARCALDKPYVQEAHKGQLASLPSNTGNNYTYTLTGSGVTASSQDKDYELSIKSYEDGRICCSGTYCASLNKKYPSCDELPADNSGCGVADVGTSTNPCAGGDCEPEAPACDGSHTEGQTFYKEECECGKATYAWHCGEDTNYAWQEKLLEPCAGKPDSFSTSCGPCGTQTMVYKCMTDNQWHPIPEGGCRVPEGYSNECEPGTTQQSACDGSSAQHTRTCSNTCAWGEWSDCLACEHGSRPDGTCKQPKYGWKFDSTGTVSTSACPYNNITNPTEGAPMSPSICYANCPTGENTITKPADGIRCGECNEQTGAYYCIGTVTTSLEPYAGQDKYNFCNFTVFSCTNTLLIGYE